jgi:hypothetical protein
MEDKMTPRERAEKRVEEIKGFYVHLMVYSVVNLGLFLINLVTRDGGGWWFYWPLLGWGIGLTIHAATLLFEGPFGPRWEERKVRELMDRDRHAA